MCIDSGIFCEGGGGLAVALILGIVIGTYASIFIATPIMFDVTKKAEAKAAKKVQK